MRAFNLLGTPSGTYGAGVLVAPAGAGPAGVVAVAGAMGGAAIDGTIDLAHKQCTQFCERTKAWCECKTHYQPFLYDYWFGTVLLSGHELWFSEP